MNTVAAVGAGLHRKPYRIREWLAERGLNMSDVARAAGVCPRVVQNTVRGRQNDTRALRKLYEMGCPEEYLSLPERLKEEFGLSS